MLIQRTNTVSYTHLHSVLAILKGNLADVLIIDYHLAEKLMGLLK